jgi:hypothetical protein
MAEEAQPVPVESPRSHTASSPRSPITAQPETAAGIEADDDENDSAYAESLASSTTSIGSSVLKFREENGRTYHAYKVCFNQTSHIPNVSKILNSD